MKLLTDKTLNPRLIYFAILAYPILLMSVPRTTTALATLLAIWCIFSIIGSIEKIFKSLDIRLITIAFSAYVIAIILTQIALNKFTLHEFQQQGRLLLLLPLFYYIYNNKINMALMAKYCLPMACVLGSLSSLYLFQGAALWGGRHTVLHIDPLNFGYLMLFLAFGSLILALRWAVSKWYQILYFIAFFCGVWMSIKSGSRTGWLAIPFVFFWILYILNQFKISSLLIIITFIVLVGLILYFKIDTIHGRVDDLIKGFIQYSWDGSPEKNNTSVGIRISMLRMGWHCFTQAPWFGFGSESLYHILNIDTIRLYATDDTIKFASSGFMHNEFVTQVVKHGIVGGLAYLFILFCIVHIYIKTIKLKISSPMIDIFIIYIIFAVISSLSTEILVVKPMILFFGFMLACFAGEALWRIKEVEIQSLKHESTLVV